MAQGKVLEKFAIVLIVVLISLSILPGFFIVWWQLTLIKQLKYNYPSCPENLATTKDSPNKEEISKLQDSLLECANLQRERIIAENSVRTTLFTAIGVLFTAISGLFFIVTAYFSWGNLEVSKKTLKATEDKQISERFNEAVKLLVHAEKHVHLGGIYALGKIADTEKYYYKQAMEMLIAYVRENAPYKKDNSNTSGTAPEEPSLTRPPTNIRVILNILSKSRSKLSEEEKRSFPPDLHETDLRKIKIGNKGDLSGAILTGTNLREANLMGVNLTEADLTGADLTKTRLQNAYLTRARLKNAILIETDFTKTELDNISLVDTDLSQAKNLKLKQLESASCYDKETRLPPEYSLICFLTNIIILMKPYPILLFEFLSDYRDIVWNL